MPSLSHMTWIWPDLVILPHTAPHRRTPPPVTCLVQSGCVIHIPHYLIDYVPHRDMSLAHISPHAPTPPKCEDHFPSLEIDDTTAPKQQNHPFKTAVNKIGVFRRYTHTIMVPKKWGESRSCMWLTDNRYPAPVNREAIHEISHSMYKPFKAFPNFSTAMYMVAYFSGISKAHATSLAKIMQHPKFQWEELKNFNAHVENVQVDSYLKHRAHPFQTQNSWQEATVYICLPVENRIFSSEGNTKMLPIYGLYNCYHWHHQICVHVHTNSVIPFHPLLNTLDSQLRQTIWAWAHNQCIHVRHNDSGTDRCWLHPMCRRWYQGMGCAWSHVSFEFHPTHQLWVSISLTHIDYVHKSAQTR